jgi:hypothetical protein
MNLKQLILLLIMLAVIGSAGLILYHRNQDSWAVPEARMGDKVLPDFQPNHVAAIHIKGALDLNLAHENDGWRVRERHNYPANFHQISDVLIKLKSLKVVEADTAEPSDLARVNLAGPGTENGGGTLVEFKDAQGQVTSTLLVGKKHIHEQNDSAHSFIIGGTPDGCYVLLPGDPKDVLLISDPLSSLQANPQTWLNKDFFKADKIRSISLASPNAEDSWKLAREDESSSWALADGKPGEVLNAGRISSAANTLVSPRFVDVTVSNDPAATGLERPKVVTIETFDHFTYMLKVGNKSPDGNYYMTVSVTAEISAGNGDGKLRDKLKQEQALAPWIYTMSSWILEPLVAGRAQLLANGGEASRPAGASGKGSSGWTPHVIH